MDEHIVWNGERDGDVELPCHCLASDGIIVARYSHCITHEQGLHQTFVPPVRKEGLEHFLQTPMVDPPLHDNVLIIDDIAGPAPTQAQIDRMLAWHDELIATGRLHQHTTVLPNGNSVTIMRFRSLSEIVNEVNHPP